MIIPFQTLRHQHDCTIAYRQLVATFKKCNNTRNPICAWNIHSKIPFYDKEPHNIFSLHNAVLRDRFCRKFISGTSNSVLSHWRNIIWNLPLLIFICNLTCTFILVWPKNIYLVRKCICQCLDKSQKIWLHHFSTPTAWQKCKYVKQLVYFRACKNHHHNTCRFFIWCHLPPYSDSAISMSIPYLAPFVHSPLEKATATSPHWLHGSNEVTCFCSVLRWHLLLWAILAQPPNHPEITRFLATIPTRPRNKQHVSLWKLFQARNGPHYIMVLLHSELW